MESRKEMGLQGRRLQVGACAALFVALLWGVPVQAGVYKWVDAEGQVHYSQQPPEQEAQRLEVLRVEGGSKGQVTPQTTQAKMECGRVTPPQQVLDPVANILRWRQATTIWQQAIDENKERDDAEARQLISELNCAINHAKRELAVLEAEQEGINENHEKVTKELEELQQSIAACDDPERDEDAPPAEECRRQYQQRLEELQTMKKQLDGRKKMLEQGEKPPGE